MQYRKYFLTALVVGVMAGSAAYCDEDAAEPQPSVGSGPAQSQLAKPSEPGNPYTSVIIDATGFDLQRCMSPKVRKADGTEVWGTIKVDYDLVEERGIVGYATTLEEAKKNSRCGKNPVVVRAVAILGGKLNSDPVVMDEDAALLLAENGKSHFLDKLNVIFIKGGTRPANTTTAKAE